MHALVVGPRSCEDSLAIGCGHKHTTQWERLLFVSRAREDEYPPKLKRHGRRVQCYLGSLLDLAAMIVGGSLKAANAN